MSTCHHILAILDQHVSDENSIATGSTYSPTSQTKFRTEHLSNNKNINGPQKHVSAKTCLGQQRIQFQSTDGKTTTQMSSSSIFSNAVHTARQMQCNRKRLNTLQGITFSGINTPVDSKTNQSSRLWTPANQTADHRLKRTLNLNKNRCPRIQMSLSKWTAKLSHQSNPEVPQIKTSQKSQPLKF